MIRLFGSVARLLFALAVVLLVPPSSFSQAPPNDECAGATVIASLPFSTTQDTRLATPNPSDPVLSCADGGGGKTVWFKYTADSTRYVNFSTLGSTPSDYDVALALFTGTCGNLVEVRCNDDAQGTRQSQIVYEVRAGTTYLVHVAEWKGGGPNGGIPTGGTLVFTVSVTTAPVIARGPKSGSVPSGVIVRTDDFVLSPVEDEAEARVMLNNPPTPLLLAPKDVLAPKGPEGSNYIEDSESQLLVSTTSRPVVLKNFPGIPDEPVGGVSRIPPDPIIAAGPDHIIACVNSRFRIWTKNGDIVKTIRADQWFGTALPGASPFDPSVIYDHFDNRWILVWDNFTPTTGHFLISVSDDANPLGTWYNWATPSTTVGDSATPFWGDYPHVGYDQGAVYITSRQFPLAGGAFAYCKVRIIAKSVLYANTAGPLSWMDLWDFRDPDDNAVAPDGVMPTITFGSPGVYFLVNDSPFRPGTYFTLRTISNSLTSPSMGAVNVPVVAYTTAPNANQLGGGTPLIEAGGSRIRSKAVYRDSSLWVVHSVASGPGNANSAVRYVRFDPFTASNLEDVAMGLQGFWHYYTAIMVNQEKDVLITYSRSGTTEYVGAYLSGRKNSDPPGLSPSVRLKLGEANYVKTFGGPRNRWGDYNGIALDPAEPDAFWAFTEYAASPANTWGTWVGKAKIGPLPGAFIEVDKLLVAFGNVEVSRSSDTVVISITNNGLDTLVISSISWPSVHFNIIGAPVLPLRIATFGTARLRVAFAPQSAGVFNDSITIASNAANEPSTVIKLSGRGFVITPAQRGVLYAASGITDGGRLFSVNRSTGAATPVGATGYTQIVSLRPHPRTGDLIGLVPSGANHLLVRINSAAGDAYPIATITLTNLKGMAFSADGTLHIGASDGKLYRVNMVTGATTEVATTAPVINIAGLAFHPTTGQLWASVRPAIANRDRIYRIELPSGTTTLVGSTGFGGPTPDIVFDGDGTLYGLIGTGSATNSLIRIDTSTAVGTLIGSMGIVSMQAIAILPDSPSVVWPEPIAGRIPADYALERNYPNPFNPSTVIEYALPVQSRVSLKIYNILGQEVVQLVNQFQPHGYFQVEWHGTNRSGAPVSSGLYFYSLEAIGHDGRTFRDVKKMVLLK